MYAIKMCFNCSMHYRKSEVNIPCKFTNKSATEIEGTKYSNKNWKKSRQRKQQKAHQFGGN